MSHRKWYALAWAFSSIIGGIASLLLMWGFYAFDDGRWVSEPLALRLMAMTQIAATGIAFTALAWQRGTPSKEAP